MIEQEYDAKHRLEEGVTLLELVEKCPRSEGGKFLIPHFSRHTLYTTVMNDRWSGTYSPTQISQLCTCVEKICDGLVGHRPKFRQKGKGGSLSQAMAENMLPDIEEAAKSDARFREVFSKIRIQISPSSASNQKSSVDKKGDPVASEEKFSLETIIEGLEKFANVIVEGVAGCGKSHLLEGLRNHYGKNTEVVVFHPSTSYEDFVSGLRPQLDGSFKGKAGVFVDMCERAGNDPGQNHLLFIDEINRANTSRVFGDLMLVLEASKRVDLADATGSERTALLVESSDGAIALQTPVSLDEGSVRKYLRVPRNLHILGTMNTTDRSVGTIDLALRRRFHWITMEPLSGDQLSSELQEEGVDVDSLRPLIDWYSRTNEQLNTKVGPDARLGHSYFFGEGKSAADVATGLLNQLKEVVATFNIKTADVESIIGAGAPVGDEHWRIHLLGQGLGRRPEIDKVRTGQTAGADGQGGSQGSGSEETSPAAQD